MGRQLVSPRCSTCPLPWVKGCASPTKSTPSLSQRHTPAWLAGVSHIDFREKGRLGGPVTAPMLAMEWDGLPLGLGLSFISKRRQMVGLALAPSSQSPKVHFCDGCGEWERCREGWGTSARADNGGQSMSGLSSRRLAFTYYSFPHRPLEDSSFWVYLPLAFIALLFAALISRTPFCLPRRCTFKFDIATWLEKSIQTLRRVCNIPHVKNDCWHNSSSSQNYINCSYQEVTQVTYKIFT